MRASPRVRLITLVLVFIPGLLALAAYVATRDWQRLARQVERGHAPTWPPPAKPTGTPQVVEAAQDAASRSLTVAAVALAAILLLAALAALCRTWWRRRRA